MTLEEAMARIYELEQENRNLSNSHRERRERLPENVKEIAPFLIWYDSLGNPHTHRYDEELNRLCYAIRSFCFPHEIRMRKWSKTGKKSPTDYPISLLSMSDEQYESYLETVGECLKAIAKCREAWFSEPAKQ